MLTALLLTLASQAEYGSIDEFLRAQRVDRVRRAGGRSGRGYAFFEAFPTGGAGTFGACSTTTPKGAKGEALTFTRTGNATCSKKGLASAGIADGDLVVLTGNVARVEPDADGILGLRVEGSRQNNALHSQALENAVWSKAGTFAPTVSTDFAVSPDGTTTAERVQFGATSAGQSSYVAQIAPTSAIGSIFSGYVRGNGTSGTIDVCTETTATAQYCVACAYTSTSWTRCVTAPSNNANPNIYFGNISLAAFNGGVARGAADVLIWGAQLEVGTYATSYIPTTSAAVTRNADAASFALSFNTAAGYSIAANNQSAQPAASGPAIWASVASLYADVTNRTQLYRVNTNSDASSHISASGNKTAQGTSSVFTDLASVRQALSMTAPGASSTLVVYRNGSLIAQNTTGATSAFTATSLFVTGLTSSTAGETQLVSRICVDPDPSRCR